MEWVAIPFSRVSSQARDRTWVSCIAGRIGRWAVVVLAKSEGLLVVGNDSLDGRADVGKNVKAVVRDGVDL